jgi:hypothetical protein
MKFILEYAGYGHGNLALPKGIVLTNQERMEMCKIIAVVSLLTTKVVDTREAIVMWISNIINLIFQQESLL